MPAVATHYGRTMTGAAFPGVATYLADLALELRSQTGTEAVLRTIVHGAVDLVPGARRAGIFLIEDGKVQPHVPSDAVVAELDSLQSSLDEGPCVSALRDERTVLIDDMALETRWPLFTAAALQRGIHSMLSFPLYARSENIGALNLYSGESGVFGEDSVFIGELLAQHSSVALAGAVVEDQLRDAITTRDLIGQAKGILMERENSTRSMRSS